MNNNKKKLCFISQIKQIGFLHRKVNVITKLQKNKQENEIKNVNSTEKIKEKKITFQHWKDFSFKFQLIQPILGWLLNSLELFLRCIAGRLHRGQCSIEQFKIISCSWNML